MPFWLNLLAILIFSIITEIGWVVCVRFVVTRKVSLLVMTAMGMQLIGYLSTLILVQYPGGAMIAGVIGSGIGALLAMRCPDDWFEKSDPKR